MSATVTLILLLMSCCAIAGPLGIEKLVNITVSVPYQTQTHGDPKQICTPPKWHVLLYLINPSLDISTSNTRSRSDYFVFYFGNYFAHVATVQTYPGESGHSTLKALALALVLPAAGVMRGLTTIIRCAIRQKTPLQTAARAGALCMVVRSKDWLPVTGGSQINGLFVRAAMKYPPSALQVPKFLHCTWLNYFRIQAETLVFKHRRFTITQK